MIQKVSSSKRTITYEMTPEEAQVIIDWHREHPAEPPTAVKHFLEPLFAVAHRREYGGH